MNEATAAPEATTKAEARTMGIAGDGVKYEPRMTHREWREYVRARRAWDRHAVVATAAVVLAEVAACVAWTAWTAAISAPRPRARG